MYIKQALVVQRLDSAIKWINPFPIDKLLQNINRYALDSGLPSE